MPCAGLALLNMLVYHAMYDWVYIFGHASGWYDIWSTHCHVWQQYICWSFILLSGYSFTLSRRPLKNGLLTAACAVVLTVATAVAMPEEVIWFGVLHLLGCAALLTCLLHPALEKLPPLAGVTGSAVLCGPAEPAAAGLAGV
ncbi:MAG: heparan-alpha-glucosaminide N-acetyltransferase domain-containing protein [Subdoligranulum sp.]